MWTLLGLMSITGWICCSHWRRQTPTDAPERYTSARGASGGTYVCPEREGGRDDEGVGAAKAQFLAVDTLSSCNGPDHKLSADREKEEQ